MLSHAAEKFIGVATLAALSNNKVITSLFPKSPKGGLEHVDLAFEIDLILDLESHHYHLKLLNHHQRHL